MNKDTINIGTHLSESRNGITGSYGKFHVWLFEELLKFSTETAPFYMLTNSFWIEGVNWYIYHCKFHCISLMTGNTESLM